MYWFKFWGPAQFVGNIPVVGPGDPLNALTGLDDRYHAILVGPCEPDVAKAEAHCPLVDVIGLAHEEGFDCSYEEWVELLRRDVQQAAREAKSRALQPAEHPSDDTGCAERIERAMTRGLEDGTRIVARNNGWVVAGNFNSYLLDPEEASWMIGDGDHHMPPSVFPTTVAAYRAWERAEEVGKTTNSRRDEALRRIGNR